MFKKISIVSLLFLIMIALPVSAETTYTETTREVCNNGVCTLTMFGGPQFYYDGDWNDIDVRVNTKTQELFGETYSYYVEDGLYSAYFKSKSGITGQNQDPVRIVDNGYTVTISPEKLNFVGDIKDNIVTATGTTGANWINYQHQFGTGLDLYYSYWQDIVKEELRIDSRQDLLDEIKSSPVPGDQLLLGLKIKASKLSDGQDLSFRIGKNKVSWDEDYTNTTSERIEFLDEDDNVIFTIPIPVAYDSSGNSPIRLQYNIDYSQQNKMTIEILTPWDWLDTATYPVFIDPSVTIGGSGPGELGDSYVQEGSPDTNFESETKLELAPINIRWSYIKMNTSIIPSGNDIINASIQTVLSYIGGAPTGIATVFAFPIDNTSWQPGTITWNNQPTQNTTEQNSTATTYVGERVKNNVTTYTRGCYVALANCSYRLAGSGDIQHIASLENTNSSARPRLIVSYGTPAPPPPTGLTGGANITVFNAVTNQESPSYDITFQNSSDIFFFSGETNQAVFNWSNITTGATNITISKTGFDNATYQVTIDDSHIENLTGRIYMTSRGLIDIVRPADGGFFLGDSVTLNITSPSFKSQTLARLSYELNASGNFIELCTNCNGSTAALGLGGIGSQDFLVLAESSIYGAYYEYSNFTNALGSGYDLLIMDEMRNITMDMSLVQFANFTAFCPTTELSYDITSNFTENLNVTCPFDYLQLEMKLFNQSIAHFRTLIPPFDVEQVTFYMNDNITFNPDTNFIDVKIFLDDLTGNFPPGSIVNIRKAINGSIVDMIEQITDAEASVLAYLVIGERYRISVENAAGTINKDLGDLYIRNLAETTLTLRISDLGIFPEVRNEIDWEFFANVSEGFINFTYFDKENLTTLITFNIFNATDPSIDPVLVYTDNSATPTAEFSWYSAQGNNTYIAQFIANHPDGELRQDVVFMFFEQRLFSVDILDENPIWYQIIALMVIMLTALLFGARVAQFGSVVVIIETAFFIIIGWLPLSVEIISLVALISVLSWLGLRRREQ